jgi:hypothetical protein
MGFNKFAAFYFYDGEVILRNDLKSVFRFLAKHPARVDEKARLCDKSRCGFPSVPEDGCCDDVDDNYVTLLRVACLNTFEDRAEAVSQGAVIALILLAGSDDAEAAEPGCGVSYEPDGIVCAEMDVLPRRVLTACVVPAAARAAGWPRALRRLQATVNEAECVALVKSMFVEQCCKPGETVNLFVDDYDSE